jgi:Alw26I/Eco31I/Esp3I family type II restriction m6 adenine DNA methyltransferase
LLDRPADIAVRILRDTYNQVNEGLESRSFDSSTLSEVVRIIALTSVLSSWESDTKKSIEKGLLTELSPTGYRNHVDPDLVLSLVTDLLPEMQFQSEHNSISKCTPLILTDVLGNIHSIGSHTLPPRGFSIKRLQGAFYTPSDVAYFIAKRTISPALQELWNQADGADSFIDQLLQLRILDPCCGPGVFLICSLEVIQSKTKELGITSPLPLMKLVTNLYGVDIDTAALEIAQLCLNLYASGSLSKSAKSRKSERLCAGNSIINLVAQDGTHHGRYFRNYSSRHPFEWKSRFSSVFKRGGFDFVLFNPPYERLKPNMAEFMRESLRAGYAEIKLQEYDTYKALMMEDLNYFRNSGEFQHSISSSMNTYQIFIERAIQVSKVGGRIGFVVPTTLLGDFSSRKMRKHLLYDHSIISIEEFTESARLFPGVTQSVCIAVVENGSKSTSFSIRYGLETLDDSDSTPPIKVTTKGIDEVFGNSLSIPRVDERDWKVLQKLHSHPSVSSYDWLANHRGELDLTIDKRHVRSGTGKPRLIRGRDIGRYSLLSDGGGMDSEFVDMNAFKDSKINSRRIQHVSEPRIACQQVSNLRNQWRLKFSRIQSDTILANSCNYLSINSATPSFILDYILGVMNSELLNWRFNISSTNNHVSNREIASLPLVNPFEDSNRDTARSIASHVKKIKINTPRIIHEIESLVFILYRIKSSQARRILRTRGLSNDDIKSIVDF